MTSAEPDNRIEDIKSKLERYKRERDELDKIRNKYHSKSQERSISTMSNQNMSSTMMMSRTGGVNVMKSQDKENVRGGVAMMEMQNQKSVIMN